MKVEQIRLLPLGGCAGEGWSEEYDEAGQMHTLLEVITAEGVTGLGSVYTSAASVAASLEILRPFWKGASALDPAAVTESFHQHTFWQGRGGAITHTISGIDIALWDIFGKVTGQPISRLLGGRYREKIKPYGSILMGEPQEMAAKIEAGLERGFKAFKIGWGPFGRRDTTTDEAIIAATRAAAGPDVEIMVDAGGSDAYWPHGYKWAIQAARMLANYDVAWFEEALRPDDIDGYVKLTEHSPIPISACEVLTRRQSFIPWIERRAVDYIQPDVTKVGGLYEQHRIGQYADEHSIMMIPHGWNTAVGLAADLQLIAAAKTARWVEYYTPAPYIEELFQSPPQLTAEGELAIPHGPGLGWEWNPEGIARYTGGLALTPSVL